MAKRIAISLDNEQLAILNSLKGLGKKDAEKVKNILMAYLSEKGYLDKYNKQNSENNNSEGDDDE